VVELFGAAVVATIADYFDSLWQDPQASEIRSVNRLNEAGIESVRDTLRLLHRGEQTTTDA
jgi:hypothetical protein